MAARQEGGNLVGQRFPRLAVMALVGLVCLAACTPQSATTPPALTSAHIIRTSAFPGNHIPPFERTVTDAAKVQQLYAMLVALPAMPPGIYHCPVDLGVQYHLTFFTGNTPFTSATVDAGGCGGVTVGNSSHWWARDATFWQQFADDLGVPEAMVYPVAPQSSGPSAPTAVP
jgi:hypothetical protein